MTTRTLDSFDFPKIGVSTFFKIGAPGRVVGAMYTRIPHLINLEPQKGRIGMGWWADLGFG